MSRNQIRFAAIRSTALCGAFLLMALIGTSTAIGDEVHCNGIQTVAGEADASGTIGVAPCFPLATDRPIGSFLNVSIDETSVPSSVPPVPAPPAPGAAAPQAAVPVGPPLPPPGVAELPPFAAPCGGGCCCTDLLNIAPNMFGADFGAGTGNIDFSIPHLKIAKIQMVDPAESVLGRQTIADDSSPMPRDRFFFDYDYFYQVPFVPNEDTVNRFTSGFEKTFFGGNVSAEVRLPFGTTLNNDILVKTGKVVHGITDWNYAKNGEETLLGNVAFGAKALLYCCPDHFAVSAGMLVTVPTANDVTVTGLLSPLHATTASLEIKNEAVHLAPYLGALWTPTANWFLQGFLQVDFDANGQKVVLENGASTSDLGRFRDQAFVYFDASIGYWITRNEYFNWAGMFEVHYNASLERPESLSVSPGQVQLGSADGSINLVDLVLGTSVQVCDNKTVALAYVFAVGAGQDDQFTREIRATFNWYF